MHSLNSPSHSQSFNMEMNRSMLLDFEEILNFPEFNRQFNYLELQLSAFLRWIYTSENEVATRIVARMAQKKASRKGKKFMSLFDPTENQVLRELGTEQMRQLNRAALSVRTLSDGSQRIRQMFRNTFQTLLMFGKYYGIRSTDSCRSPQRLFFPANRTWWERQ